MRLITKLLGCWYKSWYKLVPEGIVLPNLLDLLVVDPRSLDQLFGGNPTASVGMFPDEFDGNVEDSTKDI